MQSLPPSPGSDLLDGDVGAALLSTTPLCEVIAAASASSVGDRAPALLEGETEQPKFTVGDWQKWWRDQKSKWSESDYGKQWSEGRGWHDDGKQWREGRGWHDDGAVAPLWTDGKDTSYSAMPPDGK